LVEPTLSQSITSGHWKISPERDRVTSLETEQFAGFRRPREFVAEFLEDAADLPDLLGVRSRQLAARDQERGREADPNIAGSWG
jgi:hypothetical protein